MNKGAVGGMGGEWRERATGIEPALEAWEAAVMPFHYARANRRTGFCAKPTWRGAKANAGGRGRPARGAAPYPSGMSFEDHGSTKAISGAALQLVGGLLIATALYFAYLDGVRSPISIGLGGLAALYFTVSGGVRVYVGIVTRRSGG